MSDADLNDCHARLMFSDIEHLLDLLFPKFIKIEMMHQSIFNYVSPADHDLFNRLLPDEFGLENERKVGAFDNFLCRFLPQRGPTNTPRDICLQVSTVTISEPSGCIDSDWSCLESPQHNVELDYEKLKREMDTHMFSTPHRGQLGKIGQLGVLGLPMAQFWVNQELIGPWILDTFCDFLHKTTETVNSKG
ncbi:unnamed protein product [Toxocara canis]|uniref:Rab3 GTPase-activating protein catalytic subunit n=1 Tax=Toxocara canis TaxID=6265 RepID=A0A183UM04_TOXCA|nr:unnamed protein product [Toxocara canis]